MKRAKHRRIPRAGLRSSAVVLDIAASAETPLIRRVVTADRGGVLVTTHEVLQCIRSLGRETFTTRDVANALAETMPGVDAFRREYSIRASIKWLRSRGYVMPTRQTEKRYTPANEPYWVAVYELIDRGGEVDCDLLNRIFLLRG